MRFLQQFLFTLDVGKVGEKRENIFGVHLFIPQLPRGTQGWARPGSRVQGPSPGLPWWRQGQSQTLELRAESKCSSMGHKHPTQRFHCQKLPPSLLLSLHGHLFFFLKVASWIKDPRPLSMSTGKDAYCPLRAALVNPSLHFHFDQIQNIRTPHENPTQTLDYLTSVSCTFQALGDFLGILSVRDSCFHFLTARQYPLHDFCSCTFRLCFITGVCLGEHARCLWAERVCVGQGRLARRRAGHLMSPGLSLTCFSVLCERVAEAPSKSCGLIYFSFQFSWIKKKNSDQYRILKIC